MNETEKKALALLNEVAKEMGLEKVSSLELDMPGERALLRAIEQHEAFRQEVSDAVETIRNCTDANKRYGACVALNRFILPKPVDPLKEVLNAMMLTDYQQHELRAALAARGLEVRKIGEGE